MRKSDYREEFDKWLTKNYSELVRIASNIHTDNRDLVHHTYHRIIALEGIKLKTVMEEPLRYFVKSMYYQATRDNSQFKKFYEIAEGIDVNLIANNDLTEAFMLENFEIALDRLSWFDRTIMKLYCNGYNLTQVARESGIKTCVFHTSLHRSRKKLKQHFKNKN